MLPLDSASDSSRRRQRRFGAAVRPAVDRLESRTLPAALGAIHSVLPAPSDCVAGSAGGETTLHPAVMKANSQTGAEPDHFHPIRAGIGQSIVDGQPAMCVLDLGAPGSVVQGPSDAIDANSGAVQARVFSLARLSESTSASVGTAFAPLRVQFREGDLGVPGVVVNFTAPAVGASGAFAGPASVITDDAGIVTAPTLTANSIPGKFTVRAAIAAGVHIDFQLRNLPGSVARIDVQGPSMVRAGDTVSLTLAVRDIFGNLVSDFAGRLLLSSTDPRATLPPFIDFTTADHGTVTVPFAWRKAGAQRLSVTGYGLTAMSNVVVSP